MAVKDIFLIYNDGRLIRHLTNEYDPTQDSDVLTSMFTAISSFIEDSFKKGIRTIEFEDQRISIEQKKHFYLAMVASGDKSVRTRLADLASRIEHKYHKVLGEWDGNKNISGLTELLGEGFSENYASIYAGWPAMK